MDPVSGMMMRAETPHYYAHRHTRRQFRQSGLGRELSQQIQQAASRAGLETPAAQSNRLRLPSLRHHHHLASVRGTRLHGKWFQCRPARCGMPDFDPSAAAAACPSQVSTHPSSNIN
ncbi:hypothetical protein DL769_007369 [Monosporascus sp. CRB-8-3]|nr:hypothetical protein DL769_007369 [Monosporascus sp. CRB-8-3]